MRQSAKKLFELGKQAMLSDNYDGALKLLLNSVATNPKIRDAPKEIAFCFIALGKHSLSIPWFYAAKKREPKNVYQLKKPKSFYFRLFRESSLDFYFAIIRF